MSTYEPKKVTILGVCPGDYCNVAIGPVTTEHGAYVMDSHYGNPGKICVGTGMRPLEIFHPDVERKICVNADLDGLREDGCDPRSYDLDRNTCIYCNRSLVRTFLPYEKYLAEKYPRTHGDVTDRDIVRITRKQEVK